VSAEEFNICFDLSEVDYISSSFLRLCISSAKDVKKGNFSIINTGPEIMKVFKIAGLEGLLNVS
jgi:anti-anti-sigma factor